MILSAIIYNVDPNLVTAVLSALTGALLVSVILACGIFFLKYKADKNKMSAYEYSREENAPTEKITKKKKKNRKK